MEYNLVLYQYKNKSLRNTTSDDSKWDKLRKNQVLLKVFLGIKIHMTLAM